jgi:IMP dehydrogenase
VVTAPESTTAEAALAMIKDRRLDNVCIVNAAGELVALAAREWFKDARFYPAPGAPSQDADGKLLCGAAVGTRDADRERVAALVAAGVDAIILDSSQVRDS